MSTKKEKSKKKKTMSVVKAGPPDKECLYCALDVEDVTLKGSLSPAHIRSSKQ